jgi:hypothetical protein
MKTLAFVLLVAWAAATGGALHTVATPCRTEDSTWCYWDSTKHGNGLGRSFISLTDSLTIYTH